MSPRGPAHGIPIPSPVQAAQIAGEKIDSTPFEIRKSQLATSVSGSYFVGPGRYTDQKSQTAIYLTAPAAQTAGESKIVAMAIYTPSKSSEDFTAMAVLQTPNRPPGPPSNLVLKLSALPTNDSRVLPTRMSWKVVGDMSTGIFKGAEGDGLVYLNYSQPLTSPDGAPASAYGGTAAAHFSGLVHTNDLARNLLKGQQSGISD